MDSDPVIDDSASSDEGPKSRARTIPVHAILRIHRGGGCRAPRGDDVPLMASLLFSARALGKWDDGVGKGLT